MWKLEKLNRWLGVDESAQPHHAQVLAHAKSLLASLVTMAWFVEARDPYTGGHLWRVCGYAHMLALKAGLSVAAAAEGSH